MVKSTRFVSDNFLPGSQVIAWNSKRSDPRDGLFDVASVSWISAQEGDSRDPGTPQVNPQWVRQTASSDSKITGPFPERGSPPNDAYR